MTSIPVTLPKPLERAIQLARKAAELEKKRDRSTSLRLRRKSFASLQYFLLARPDQPAPNQWGF